MPVRIGTGRSGTVPAINHTYGTATVDHENDTWTIATSANNDPFPGNLGTNVAGGDLPGAADRIGFGSGWIVTGPQTAPVVTVPLDAAPGGYVLYCDDSSPYGIGGTVPTFDGNFDVFPTCPVPPVPTLTATAELVNNVPVIHLLINP